VSKEVRAIARSSSITKWNVLALLAAAVGAAVTLGSGQVWLENWSRTGQQFPIGRRESLQLPAGPTLVYYESLVAVPMDGDSSARLRVATADGELLPIRPLRQYDDGDSGQSMDYRLWFTGWSGRALWEVNVPHEGRYSVVCHNHSVMSDKDIPADDRVVFLREPNSFELVRKVRTFILVTGATLTMTAVILLYALHNLALRKRKSQRAAGEAAQA
jgi:hypothetical protein